MGFADMDNSPQKTLLIIVEQGGYRIHADLLAAAGYQVSTASSMRKALTQLKARAPDVILAEFNRSIRVHDRVSNLEPLLAHLQTGHRGTRLVVMIDRQDLSQLEPLRNRFPIADVLIFPFDGAQLVDAVRRAELSAPSVL